MMKLLVIDDELDIIEVVAEQIELMGYQVYVLKATSVEEAKKLIDECDMIISDVKMPQNEQLEKMLEKAKQPLARITGHHDMKGDLIIRKPFELSNFRSVLDKLMTLAI
jgi:CheY-like chemotaxis protein